MGKYLAHKALHRVLDCASKEIDKNDILRILEVMGDIRPTSIWKKLTTALELTNTHTCQKLLKALYGILHST